MHVMHALFSPTVVEVSWIISESIEVTEGERDPLELYAQAVGLYATPIEIDVVCAEIIATVPSGVDSISSTDSLEHASTYLRLFTYLFAAYPERDFVVLSGSTLNFTDVETLTSNSSNRLTLSIIDDNIAELWEYFICTLQGGAVYRVRGIEPNRVTVEICDDDGK